MKLGIEEDLRFANATIQELQQEISQLRADKKELIEGIKKAIEDLECECCANKGILCVECQFPKIPEHLKQEILEEK